MPEVSGCPGQKQLEGFLLGRLPPEEVERLAGPVEQCGLWVDRLHNLRPADVLVDAMQATGDEPPEDAAHLLPILRALRPSWQSGDTESEVAKPSDEELEVCHFLA